MYLDYSNLWKQLAQKGISKSDLMQLTGLSSRVVAKLVKNETVTTDTIARICAALSCRVEDIMEYSDENALSLYGAFRTLGKAVEENDDVKKIAFEMGGQKYAVYMTKKSATRATGIYCESDETVYWEQRYMMGGHSLPQIVKSVLLKPERRSDEITIVVIKGKPSIIIGLDEGIWVSAKNGKLKSKKDIFVMSEAVFKVFRPQ